MAEQTTKERLRDAMAKTLGPHAISPLEQHRFAIDFLCALADAQQKEIARLDARQRAVSSEKYAEDLIRIDREFRERSGHRG
jgi:hypothetical protein